MKDDVIRIRVAAPEKEQIRQDATNAGFDDVSAYMLHLARQNRSRLKR